MPFVNLSFETPCSNEGSENDGLARGWVFSGHSQYQYAGFGVSFPLSFEGFEKEWSANEVFKFGFTDEGDLIHATFGVAQNLTVETFEKEWSQNETFASDIQGVSAVFTGGFQVDDFESNWNNATFLYSLASTATASFDITPEAFEDFEEDWVTGYKYSFVGLGTDLTAATFDTGAHAFENFEGTWFLMTTI